MIPSDFPRRILLMTVGQTPQVVTETVYALANAAATNLEARFVPTQIHLITTTEGRRQVALDLFGSGNDHWRALCEELALPHDAISFGMHTVHLIGADENGNAALDDIRTVSDNASAADSIIRIVRELTADSDSALHVSLAGGRKTMGFYLGYALSLFGRPQDRLSHVLVDRDYQDLRDFFYPTPATKILRRPDGRTVDARDAVVTLADIPFVSLRGHLGPELLGDADAGYSEMVRRATTVLDTARASPMLTLHLQHHLVNCGGVQLRLSAGPFAWYCWFAQRAKEGDGALDWRVTDSQALRAIADRLHGPRSGRLDGADWSDGNNIDEAALQVNISRINRALGRKLGPGPAAFYRIVRSGKRSSSRYELRLAPAQIEFVG